MTSQEVGLKIALYFAECDKIQAAPRMDEITRLIELYNPQSTKEFPTCSICGESDQYVTHGDVHAGCCLSCDIDQNIVCESCNKTRKPHILGAKICYKCFKSNK